jgi:uncharacterized protein YciI
MACTLPRLGRSSAGHSTGRAGSSSGRRILGPAGDVGSGLYVPAMAIFAVTLVHGPNRDASRPIREQQAWDQHAAFMDGLVAEGMIILGGPLGDGEQTLHAVEAADEREFETRLGEDPWASMGLLQIGSVQPWALWLDGRHGSPER